MSYWNVTREEGYRCVGKGWHTLLDALFDFTEKHNITVVQVKEKFGGLRFYTNGIADEKVMDECWKMTQDAERKSVTMCEECGHPGKRRMGGWIKTLCDDHAKGAEKGDIDDIEIYSIPDATGFSSPAPTCADDTGSSSGCGCGAGCGGKVEF